MTNLLKTIEKINSTELLKAIWKLKQSGQLPEIRWKIVQHATPYQCSSKHGTYAYQENYKYFTLTPKNY